MTDRQTSRIPVVRRTLHQLIGEWLDPVQVSYGLETETSVERVEVHGPVGLGEQEYALLGDRAKDESFTLLIVFVAEGATCRAANDRAYDLFGTVELGLREHVQLGLAKSGVITASIRQSSHDEWPEDQGWRCAVGMHVRTSARI